MPDYFGEKAKKVDPRSFTAFGIPVSSRYGEAEEIVEMLNFCKMAAIKHLEHYVKEVSYDSKACICSITIEPDIKESDPVAVQLHAIAKETVGQFEWFGGIDHGIPIEEA